MPKLNDQELLSLIKEDVKSNQALTPTSIRQKYNIGWNRAVRLYEEARNSVLAEQHVNTPVKPAPKKEVKKTKPKQTENGDYTTDPRFGRKRKYVIDGTPWWEKVTQDFKDGKYNNYSQDNIPTKKKLSKIEQISFNIQKRMSKKTKNINKKGHIKYKRRFNAVKHAKELETNFVGPMPILEPIVDQPVQNTESKPVKKTRKPRTPKQVNVDDVINQQSSESENAPKPVKKTRKPRTPKQVNVDDVINEQSSESANGSTPTNTENLNNKLKRRRKKVPGGNPNKINRIIGPNLDGLNTPFMKNRRPFVRPDKQQDNLFIKYVIDKINNRNKMRGASIDFAKIILNGGKDNEIGLAIKKILQDRKIHDKFSEANSKTSLNQDNGPNPKPKKSKFEKFVQDSLVALLKDKAQRERDNRRTRRIPSRNQDTQPNNPNGRKKYPSILKSIAENVIRHKTGLSTAQFAMRAAPYVAAGGAAVLGASLGIGAIADATSDRQKIKYGQNPDADKENMVSWGKKYNYSGNIDGLTEEQTRAFAGINAKRESTFNYKEKNQYGYQGAYQFGSEALAQVGLVKADKEKAAREKAGKSWYKGGQQAFLEDPSNWHLKGGLDEFINSPAIQDKAFKDLANANIRQGRKSGALKKDATAEDIAGYAMAAHLKGPRNANKLYKDGISDSDANGTSTKSYADFAASNLKSVTAGIATKSEFVGEGIQTEKSPVAMATGNPVPGAKITSKFGPRNIGGNHSTFHKGIDFGLPVGSDVHVTKSGVVSFTGDDPDGYGKYIKVDHGDGLETRYAHLSAIGVKKGQSVEAGDVIGKSGNSGSSTGPHLHYEVRKNGNPVNPETQMVMDNKKPDVKKAPESKSAEVASAVKGNANKTQEPTKSTDIKASANNTTQQQQSASNNQPMRPKLESSNKEVRQKPSSLEQSLMADTFKSI